MRRGYAARMATTAEISTGAGPARAEIDQPATATFLLLMTHGAAGGVDTRDLLAVRDAALPLGGVVARVLQPYRVRGARAPGAPGPQDAAWLEIVAALGREYPGIPLVQGGRSNGARVACRTARQAGARTVIALAFPLHPPGRPAQTRVDELRGAGVDVLVVNGERDPFGIPSPRDAARVVVLPGETHSLTRNPAGVGAAVGSWLADVMGG